MTRKARRITWVTIVLLLLIGAATLCVVRWKAWFVNPPEPFVDRSDSVEVYFHTFGRDTVPGFERMRDTWVETDENDSLLCFMVLGDVHNALDSADWARMAQWCPDLDFYVQAGDFVERGYEFYFRLLATQQHGTAFQSLPVLTTPGNHEYRKGMDPVLPQMWFETFPNPQNGPERFLGSTYYVDFPGLRIIMIDTNGLNMLSDFTMLNAWTKMVLREARHRYAIVVMHHPVYSSCEGRQNPLVFSTFRRALREADFVFSGHDHSYARRNRFIGTNAAKKHYKLKENASFDKLVPETQCYELLTLKGNNLTLRSYDLNTGELFDEVVLHHPAW